MIAAAANIVLMGLRGSGKSTIGRLLGATLGREFVDLDDRTAAMIGAATPAKALAEGGEPAFREAEFRALGEVLASAGRVVALGGGTPTAPGATSLLERERDAGRAVIVYLRASPDELRGRLAATDTRSRPSLTGLGTLNEIEAIHAARDPLYQRLASRVEEVGGRSANEIAAELVKLAAT